MANNKHVCTINALFVSIGLTNPMHSTQDNEAKEKEKKKMTSKAIYFNLWR